jgi:aminoacyl tRNA synthase complex-interacting multifunctional protein 1
MDAVKALNSVISSIPSTTSSSSTSFDGPVASYYQQGSVTLLNDLIAELEFSLSSSPFAAVVAATASSITLDSKVTSIPSSFATSAPAPEISMSKKPESQLSVNCLDIRVGQIVSVQRHETADKLYCEEILVGEEVPRSIASGLVPYYSLEEMTNRRVLVVCNLKPRSLVGFKSSGMVLCASTTDPDGNHKVEFVDPPVDAPIGARVIGESLDFIEPLSVKQCDKQKAFNQIAPDLSVNEKGEVVWNNHRLVTEGGAACTAPTLRNCPVA